MLLEVSLEILNHPGHDCPTDAFSNFFGSPSPPPSPAKIGKSSWLLEKAPLGNAT